MPDELMNRLSADLERRSAAGLLRTLSGSELIDFSSNDYLGLATSQELFDRVSARAATLKGRMNGATGSRLLSGNSDLAEEVEHELAAVFQGEAALLFNSGYTANLGVLSSLPRREDTIIYDELAHASIKDGARLSLARRMSFRHNDLNDLESKLRRTEGNAFIVVESVYSMDGDECPLVALVALAERYSATIVLDEAHSTGVAGINGAGRAVALGVAHRIGVRLYTFGKAMGCHGACIVGTAVLRQYLINASRSFIYTTALPPHALLTISCAFAFLKENTKLIDRLHANIGQFSAHLKDHTRYRYSNTAIQCLLFPGNENVNAAASTLRGKGFEVRPIRTPTIARGSERIRICLHAFNRAEDIQALADELNRLDTEH